MLVLDGINRVEVVSYKSLPKSLWLSDHELIGCNYS